jgi:Zn-dependent M28 family amino/carboxypeptidase
VRPAPGANDNASGVAAVLEAARICSQYKFTHTIRFLAVGAEELGLIGSYGYALEAKSKGRDIITVVNGDMLGYPVVGDNSRIYFSSGRAFPALVDSALVYNRRYNLNFILDYQVGGGGGSDHESFLQAGYPAMDVSEGSAFEIWNGMDPYYHSPFDTSDKLSPELLRHCTQMMLTILTETAKPTGVHAENHRGSQ